MKHYGKVYWITGLSGAGKTTIGKSLYNHIRTRKDSVVFLDGDILREVYGNDLGYTKEDRLKAAMRNSKLCNMLSKQGIDVVCSTISMFDECRNWNRENIKNYNEIYLKVSLEVLKQRDQKGLYSTNSDNLLGINMSFEEPKSPDIVIDNNGDKRVEEILRVLVEKFNL